jgi:hypothetical protein
MVLRSPEDHLFTAQSTASGTTQGEAASAQPVQSPQQDTAILNALCAMILQFMSNEHVVPSKRKR